MNETASALWSNWCKHYNGLSNDTCEAGVYYEHVKGNKPMQYPCFRNKGCAERCALVSYPTAEEIKQHDEETEAYLAQFLQNIADDICPFCVKPITEKVQIGRCVYAKPCMCRLYQGTLPKPEKIHPYFQEQLEQEKRERP